MITDSELMSPWNCSACLSISSSSGIVLSVGVGKVCRGTRVLVTLLLMSGLGGRGSMGEGGAKNSS